VEVASARRKERALQQENAVSLPLPLPHRQVCIRVPSQANDAPRTAIYAALSVTPTMTSIAALAVGGASDDSAFRSVKRRNAYR
jgi:hypothetical protein